MLGSCGHKAVKSRDLRFDVEELFLQPPVPRPGLCLPTGELFWQIDGQAIGHAVARYQSGNALSRKSTIELPPTRHNRYTAQIGARRRTRIP